MIAQTISNDALEVFRKHLIREIFNFDWPSVETLGQVLSTWEEFRKNQFLKPDKNNADFLICEKCGARCSRKDY